MAAVVYQNFRFSRIFSTILYRAMSSGMPGSGSGKGGGAGGDIRSGGGSFGKKEQAQEDQYFRKQQQDLLDKLKREQGEGEKDKADDKNEK